MKKLPYLFILIFVSGCIRLYPSADVYQCGDYTATDNNISHSSNNFTDGSLTKGGAQVAGLNFAGSASTMPVGKDQEWLSSTRLVNSDKTIIFSNTRYYKYKNNKIVDKKGALKIDGELIQCSFPVKN